MVQTLVTHLDNPSGVLFSAGHNMSQPVRVHRGERGSRFRRDLAVTVARRYQLAALGGYQLTTSNRPVDDIVYV